jgi:hypothetical protein
MLYYAAIASTSSVIYITIYASLVILALVNLK